MVVLQVDKCPLTMPVCLMVVRHIISHRLDRTTINSHRKCRPNITQQDPNSNNNHNNRRYSQCPRSNLSHRLHSHPVRPILNRSPLKLQHRLLLKHNHNHRYPKRSLQT